MKKPVRILYVQESSSVREDVRRILSAAEGFEVMGVPLDEVFSRHLPGGEFDLVLSDLIAAGPQGLGILELVRDHAPHLPVVIYTEKGSEEIAVEALKRGARDYVVRRSQAHGEDLARAIREALGPAGERNFKTSLELDRCRTQLEAANKELEVLSYAVSHDLRAPLRAVEGFSGVLIEDYMGKLDEEGQRFLQIIGRSSRQISDMVDDLLAYSRLGRQELRCSRLDMVALVEDVASEVQVMVEEGRKVEFVVHSLPPAWGDLNLVRQVWLQLLENAAKFTRNQTHARVEVGAREEGSQMAYYVRDNGLGFDMNYGERLYGVFQRLHLDKEFEGNGIGLALVKRAVLRHGGAVWAEGKEEAGATFFFTLPQKHSQTETATSRQAA